MSRPLAALRVTANATGSPSEAEASPTDREGGESSSRINPRPVPSTTVATVAPVSWTQNVSSASSNTSWMVATEMVLAVSPTLKVSVPEAAVKSRPGTAVLLPAELSTRAS